MKQPLVHRKTVLLTERHSAGFRSKELTIAIDTGPITIDEGHGIAADRTIRRRSFVDAWEDW